MATTVGLFQMINPNVLSGITVGGNYLLEVYLHGKYNGGGEFLKVTAMKTMLQLLLQSPRQTAALLFGFIGVTVVAPASTDATTILS